MVSWVQTLILIHTLTLTTGTAGVIVLDDSNYDAVKGGYKMTLIAFGAEWCPFSQQFKPILDDASTKIVALTSTGIAAICTVDCVKFAEICSRESIRKYPTVKYALYGEVQPHEYRGERNADALINFINENLAYNVTSINAENRDYLQALQLTKSPQTMIVGLFPVLDASQPHQQHFTKAATLYRSKCAFFIVYNVNDTEDRMAHIEEQSNQPKEVTILKNADYASLGSWIRPRCVQYVSELTFANAESITDLGMPLLILFYDPDTQQAHKSAFVAFVKQHLLDQTDKLIFLYADAKRFTHPLHHVGKTEKDTPVMLIDSLNHMYVCPGDVMKALDLLNPALLRGFIGDLHSGRLHRMFHNLEPPVQPDQPPKVIPPPESVMKSLSPSPLRYTLLHDEF